MAGDTDNPRVWVNADVYVGAVDTPAPTDLVTPLNAAFEALGLLSEDGMTEAREEDKTDHYAWGGILVRTTRSKHKRTIRVIALEDNPVVFDLVNPGSEAETTGGVTTRTVKTPQPNKKAFVIEQSDGDITRRISIPTGEVLDVGDIETSDSTLAQKELTITVYPDEEGVLYHEITNDPQAAVGS
jgi:hypothetical protein